MHYNLIKKLLSDVAKKLEVDESEAFMIACACSEDRPDGEEFFKRWEEHYEAPEWFIDILIRIMGDRIPELNQMQLMRSKGGDQQSAQA